MKTVIEMAREAGATPYTNRHYPDRPTHTFNPEQLEAFAEMVRADEREKYKWDIHSCGPTCKRYACVAMREAVEAENEACAKLCDAFQARDVGMQPAECAGAIRARMKK